MRPEALLDALQKRPSGVVGEDQQRRAKVLVEIGESGETHQRLTFAALGRQKNDLAVSSLDIGAEHRRDTVAGHRLGKNQVAVVEIELDVFFVETQVADAIALIRIEARVADSARGFSSGRIRGPSRPAARPKERELSGPLVANPLTSDFDPEINAFR